MPMTAMAATGSARLSAPARTDWARSARAAPTVSSGSRPSRSRAAMRSRSSCLARARPVSWSGSTATGVSSASRTPRARWSTAHNRARALLAAATVTSAWASDVTSEPTTSRSPNPASSSSMRSRSAATAGGAALCSASAASGAGAFIAVPRAVAAPDESAAPARTAMSTPAGGDPARRVELQACARPQLARRGSRDVPVGFNCVPPACGAVPARHRRR